MESFKLLSFRIAKLSRVLRSGSGLLIIIISIILTGMMACSHKPSKKMTPATGITASSQNNGGLTLPDGFRAQVIAQNIGNARHIVIRDNGDIYIGLNEMKNGGGIVAMRDTNGDGVPDIIKYFGKSSGNGIAIHDGYLYFAPDTAVWRYKLEQGQLVPTTPPEHMVSGLPHNPGHHTKSLAFDNKGNMYVSIGSPSNACQEKTRTPGSPGMDPCPQLKDRAGIWRFKADKEGQTEKDGYRYATGIRNAVGITWNDKEDQLYAVQNGRDQLSQLWPKYYTTHQGAILPAEEFQMVNDGSNFGWPYSYYDQTLGHRVLAPEYGGNGKKIGRAAKFDKPIMAFPGHWAPLGLMFYTGNQFPAHYENGAFIAFHGSWNRSPEPQAGYRVVFVPFNGKKPASDKWENFATGFAGTDSLMNPGEAKHRPVGLAQGPRGALYITDDQGGFVWKVVYNGKK